MQPDILESFTAFYEGWITKQQHFLDQLLILTQSPSSKYTDNRCRELMSRVLEHYEQYYKERTKAAKENVFLILSAPWFTTFERTLIWVCGFKPSMMFPLVKNSVGDELTENQAEALERIKGETRRDEREIEKAMATVQESVAGPTVMETIRRHGRLVDGEVSELDDAMEEVKVAMVGVLENADGVRESSVKKVAEVLTPVQSVKFLIAAAQFMLNTRSLGMRMESESAAASGSSS